MERSHTLRPVTADDIPRLVEILYAAFADDQVLKVAYPDTPRNRTWWDTQYEGLLPRGRWVAVVKPGSHGVGVGGGTEGEGGDGEGMEKEEVVVAFGGWTVVERDNARDGNASESASKSASENASKSASKSASESANASESASASESAIGSRVMVEAAEPTSEMDWGAIVALAQARRRLRDSLMGTSGTYHCEGTLLCFFMPILRISVYRTDFRGQGST